VLEKDNEILAKRLGEMQEDKWHLEERVRYLQDNMTLVNEELTRKDLIIRHHVLKNAHAAKLTPEDLENNKQLLNNLLQGANDSYDQSGVIQRLELFLHETLHRNIQLQNDIATIADEVSQLQTFNIHLRAANDHLLLHK